MSILRDEDGAEWECVEANDGSDTPDGKAFRTLRLRAVVDPADYVHEISVSTELDLNSAVIQRLVLRWARQAADRFAR